MALVRGLGHRTWVGFVVGSHSCYYFSPHKSAIWHKKSLKYMSNIGSIFIKTEPFHSHGKCHIFVMRKTVNPCIERLHS